MTLRRSFLIDTIFAGLLEADLMAAVASWTLAPSNGSDLIRTPGCPKIGSGLVDVFGILSLNVTIIEIQVSTDHVL